MHFFFVAVEIENFLKHSKATMTKGSLNTPQADVPRLGGGPLGLGDPDDLRLRKTEKDILIPKMMREEATRRCKKEVDAFYECSKKSGLSVIFKCQDENKNSLDCIKSWMDKPEFAEEITNKYLYARSYYRRTGKPLEGANSNTMSAIPQGAFAAFKIKQNDEKSNQFCQGDEVVFDHPPLKYSSKLMNSIWGLYNRYSVHNLKRSTASTDFSVFANQRL